MKFDVTRKANADNPIQVDVLVAYDPEMVEELDRLTAGEWFSQREARLRSNPGETKFQHWRWELTPGLEFPDVDRGLKGEPSQGLIFANYVSRGKHSARFDPSYGQYVEFGYDAFRMVRGKLVDPESRGWRPPVGWSGVGLGTVGVGLGTFFAVLTNDAAVGTRGLRPKDAEKHARLTDDYDTYRTASIISFGVGAAFLVAGAAILLWPESNESPFREIQSEEDRDVNAGGSPW
ncbi:MAG: hypothetical protein KC549_00215 [Myxococcales bacterium]|nr:hypothetical protein [Myxococcales bacterium]MCB9548708.1 hypothetical protein [Myxococcales bacterium]